MQQGIFHEWITLQTLNYAGGENFVFFLLNGVATVTSTWFRRTFPEANAKIPTLVAVLLLHLFFLTVIPLFCAPFIRSGFFVQMQSLRVSCPNLHSSSRHLVLMGHKSTSSCPFAHTLEAASSGCLDSEGRRCVVILPRSSDEPDVEFLEGL